MKKPLILVGNDDGVDARGLDRLIEVAAAYGDVIAVAPDLPQSGRSSAISVDTPLRIRAHADRYGARVFSVNGTPVDCVKLALHTICPRRPSLVLAGINHGSNSGAAVTYSGTMGAVIEGCLNGIPAVGFSLTHHSLKADFELGLPQVRHITACVAAHGLPDGLCLNVNIPALCTPRGIRVCRAARGHWSEEYRRYADPQGVPFYLLTGRFVNAEPHATDTDEYWLSHQYISVVPTTPDQSLTSAIPSVTALLDAQY